MWCLWKQPQQPSRTRKKDHALPMSGKPEQSNLLGMRYMNKDRLYARYFQASHPIGAVSDTLDSRLDLTCIFRGGRILNGVIVDKAFSIIK